MAKIIQLTACAALLLSGCNSSAKVEPPAQSGAAGGADEVLEVAFHVPGMNRQLKIL